MAQQTQIARAEAYWRAWLSRFPTIEALAAATPADVLRAWRGLGYDRRALNLLRCARAVVADHGGRLPDDVPALERLPGIGPYTARAVAALAFEQRVGAVDVNVRRVVGRIVGGPAGPAALGAARLQAAADGLVPAHEPGRWTHALMDLGATICRIREPRCAGCPARSWCRAAAAWAGGAVADRSSASGPSGRSARPARPARSPRATRERAAPFSTTRRWLRGRILDRLREADGDGWTAFDDPIGGHDRAAVAAALHVLAGEGMVELMEADEAPSRGDQVSADDARARFLRARLPSR
jgi:A/G-specific adenine glycosylase